MHFVLEVYFFEFHFRKEGAKAAICGFTNSRIHKFSIDDYKIKSNNNPLRIKLFCFDPTQGCYFLKSFIQVVTQLIKEKLMTLQEKILHNVQSLPEPLQAKVLDFVEFLKSKKNNQNEENKTWSTFSLSNALRGMEDEDYQYSFKDIKEEF